MGDDVVDADAPAPVLDGRGLRVAVVCGRFNSRVTMRLLDGARRCLADAGVTDDDVVEVWVAGAFEIPVVAKAYAGSGRFHAVVALGCVIRGDTAHFDLVAGECARGLQQATLDTGVPIGFGVLTTEDLDQALARSDGPGGHNVGADAVAAAVEVAMVLASVRDR